MYIGFLFIIVELQYCWLFVSYYIGEGWVWKVFIEMGFIWDNFFIKVVNYFVEKVYDVMSINIREMFNFVDIGV